MRVIAIVEIAIETGEVINSLGYDYSGPVSWMLGGTSMPAVTPTAVPPSEDDEAVKKAKLAERRELLRRYGASKTFMSGARGLLGAAPTGKKTLLGQ